VSRLLMSRGIGGCGRSSRGSCDGRGLEKHGMCKYLYIVVTNARRYKVVAVASPNPSACERW